MAADGTETIMYQDYEMNDERTRYRRTVNVDGALVIREMTLGTDKQTNEMSAMSY